MIYLKLFLIFFKIGAFTFGGGYAMLPLIQEEVLGHGWMELEDLVNFMAVSESTPGPLAVNLSTYIGAETAGFPGALCATLGVVLPSFVIILIVARCFAAFQENGATIGVVYLFCCVFHICVIFYFHPRYRFGFRNVRSDHHR